jgi:alpha-beta hydrolase superfamily lysophospholipase
MPEAPADAERRIPGLTPALQRRLRRLFRILTFLHPSLAARVAANLFLTPRTRPILAEDAAFLATARTLRLSTPAGAVQVYDWPGAEPTVLIVHGWISHAARLADLIRALQERGRRVVAFDAPAHGRSAGRQADMYSFRDAVAAIDSYCVATDATALGPGGAPASGAIGAILAHSFGAVAAASYLAEAAPANIRAAVLVGLPRDVGYLFDSFTIAMGLRDNVRARVRELFRRRYGAYPESYSALAFAQRISIPVLLVHGGADEFIPATQALENARQLRDARLIIVPGLKHSAPLRDPATVQQMVEFIETQLAPARG